MLSAKMDGYLKLVHLVADLQRGAGCNHNFLLTEKRETKLEILTDSRLRGRNFVGRRRGCFWEGVFRQNVVDLNSPDRKSVV